MNNVDAKHKSFIKVIATVVVCLFAFNTVFSISLSSYGMNINANMLAVWSRFQALEEAGIEATIQRRFEIRAGIRLLLSVHTVPAVNGMLIEKHCDETERGQSEIEFKDEDVIKYPEENRIKARFVVKGREDVGFEIEYTGTRKQEEGILRIAKLDRMDPFEIDFGINAREINVAGGSETETILLLPLTEKIGPEVMAVAVNISWIREYHYLKRAGKSLQEWAGRYPQGRESDRREDLSDLSIWPLVLLENPDEKILEYLVRGGITQRFSEYKNAEKISLADLGKKFSFQQGILTNIMRYPEVVALIDGADFHFPQVQFIGDMKKVLKGEPIDRGADWVRTFPGFPERWRGVSCDFCGRNDTITSHVIGPSRIVRCRRCNLEYDNPRAVIQSEDLGKYAVHEQTIFTGKSRKIVRAGKYAAHIIEYLEKNFPEYIGQPLLEVGCSSGELLYALRENHGWPNDNLYGVDPATKAVEFAHEHYGLQVSSDLENRDFKGKKFKFIAIVSTMEHFDDPMGQLKKIESLLADDGLLYITYVPNQQSLLATTNVSGFIEKNFPDGQHIVHYNPDTLL